MKIPNNGLDVELSEAMDLSVEGQKRTPDVRTIAQMRPVLADAVDLPETRGTYFMYREAAGKQDVPQYESRSLRYDITVLPPVMLGHEYNKTLGHYHPVSPNPPLSYPELYEVLEGTAHYLLQKRKPGTLEIQRCFLVETRSGEKAIMPPDYGHVTVNLQDSVLVMDNIVERTFKSVYEPYLDKKGAAYYVKRDGDQTVFVANPNFADLPELEQIRAPDFNRLVDAEIAQALEADFSYTLYAKNPDFFRWLVEPRDIALA